MERVTGIEPASPAWKAGALAIVLHPRLPSEEIVSLVIIPFWRNFVNINSKKNCDIFEILDKAVGFAITARKGV